MPWYIYNPKHRFTDAEREVMSRGFPFVQTNKLTPGFVLKEHVHSSNNTHYVTRGSMKMAKVRNGLALCLRECALHCWKDMGRGVPYTATAGPEGVEFVEGHTLLSPNTAQRFIRPEGTVLEVDSNVDGAFWSEDPEPLPNQLRGQD